MTPEERKTLEEVRDKLISFYQSTEEKINKLSDQNTILLAIVKLQEKEIIELESEKQAYARKCVVASLEKAACNAEMIHNESELEHCIVISTDSITDKSNIVLL